MPSRLPAIVGSYRQITQRLASDLAARLAAMPFDSRLRSPMEVIVPSAAMAREVEAALLDRGVAGAGVVFRFPETLAFELVSRAGSARQAADGMTRRLALTLAVNEAREAGIALTAGAVSWLERSLRDLLDHGASFAEVERSSRRHPEPERLAVALRVWRRTLELLDQTGQSDPSALLRSAASLVTSGAVTTSTQLLFGFYDATGLQEQLIRALLDRGLIDAAYFPFDPDAMDERASFAFASRFFQNLGGMERFTVEEAGPKIDVAPPVPHVLHTPEDESEAVVRAIAAAIAVGTRPSRIAVTRRTLSPTDVRRFQRWGARAGVTFRAPLVRSLTTSTAGRSLRTLLSLAENDFRRDAVIELAYAGWEGMRTEMARRIDLASRRLEVPAGRAAAVRERVARADAKLRSRWRDIDHYAQFVELLESRVASLSAPASPAEWAERIRALVAAHPLRSSTDTAALIVLDEIATKLAAFTAGTMAHADVITLIEDATLEEARGDEESVWLGDVMSLRGRHFDLLFLTGCEDDSFPQRRNDDALMPDAVRPYAGMRTIGDGEDEERMLFALATSAAAETHLTFVRADDRGKVRRPSRYVIATCVAAHPAEAGAVSRDTAAFVREHYPALPSSPLVAENAAAALRGGEAPPAITARQLVQTGSAARGSSFDGYLTISPALRESILARLGTMSATRFERFGDCPQHFLVSSLLDVRELEEPEHVLEIDVRKKGTLQHLILERLYRLLEPAEIRSVTSVRFDRLPASIRDKFETVSAQAFAEFAESHPAASSTIRRLEERRMRRALRQWIGADLHELAASGYLPHRLEFRFGELDDAQSGDAPPALLTFNGVTIRVRGSIDRIDFHPLERRYRILDYKDGKAGRHKKLAERVDEGRALQLAFYAAAWTQLIGCEPSQVEAAIRPLGDPFGNRDTFSFRWDERVERFNETLALFTSSMLAGRFPAFPSEEGCKYCAVNMSCRTRHDERERLQLSRYESPRELLLELAKP